MQGEDPSTPGGPVAPHGRAWKIVPKPNIRGSSGGNLLNGVAATSFANAWAVGEYARWRTLVLRW